MCRSTVVVALCLLSFGCDRSTATGTSDNSNSTPLVRLQTVDTTTVVPTTSSVGEIAAKRMSVLRAEVPGSVLEVQAEPGQHVQNGDVLLRLDVGRASSQAAASVAQLQQAKAELKRATRERDRTKRLVEQGGLPSRDLDAASDALLIAAAQYDAAQAQSSLSRRSVSDAVIRAPYDATVVARDVEVGEYVTPGTVLLTVADVSALEASVLVDARDALNIKPEAAVEVKPHARPGESFDATVKRVGDVVDPATRRLPVEVALSDKSAASGLLKPGLTAEFVVQTGEARSVIVVPIRAVVSRFESNFVFVVNSDNVATQREVTVGPSANASVEITKGLRAGEQIVIDGVGRVTDGATVRVAKPTTSNAATKPALSSTKAAP